MAVVKQWFCPAHSEFENETGLCPSGCTVTSEREFRTAPAYHNGKAKRVDSMVRSQVEAFGLSNIRSAREGETSRPSNPQAQKMAEFQKAVHQKYPSLWGTVPKDGGVPAVLAQHGAPATNALAESKQLLEAAKPRYEYVKDPQNLKVDTSKAA